MKPLANILALILVLTGLQLHGQQFIDTTNIWYAKRFVTDANGDPVPRYYSYWFSGTEVIDSMTYHKLVVTGTDSILTVYGTLEAGKYFRTEGTRTYFKVEAEEPEYLLHDFGVSLGDTITMGDFNEQLVVIGVDTIELMNGNLRKRITVEGWNIGSHYFEQDWIEGIGSTSGPMSLSASLGSFYTLNCFMRGGVTEFSEGECSLTAIDGPVKKPDVRIFPNPVMRILNIHAESPKIPMDVLLYSIEGKLVYHNSGILNGQIDISHLSAGVYLVRLIDSEKRVSVHSIVKL